MTRKNGRCEKFSTCLDRMRCLIPVVSQVLWTWRCRSLDYAITAKKSLHDSPKLSAPRCSRSQISLQPTIETFRPRRVARYKRWDVLRFVILGAEFSVPERAETNGVTESAAGKQADFIGIEIVQVSVKVN